MADSDAMAGNRETHAELLLGATSHLHAPPHACTHCPCRKSTGCTPATPLAQEPARVDEPSQMPKKKEVKKREGYCDPVLAFGRLVP